MGYDLQASALAPTDPTVHGSDKRLKIYYDETNNIRKLILTENGFNVSRYDNFVLGGVAIENEKEIADIEELRGILRIQKTADEIKFDLVAKGDFEKVLDSRKIGQVFSWLLQNDIKIHYSNLNILNWSVLDIVESIVADDSFNNYIAIHRELKNELYRMVVCDVPGFLALLKSYGYPDIKRDATSSFLKDVRLFVLKHLPLDHNQVLKILCDVLLRAQSLSELVFLVGEKPDYLIQGFENVFLNRIGTFKNSTHIFDEEKTVQAAIEGIRVMNGVEEVEFSFADSKKVPGIQLSDIVVGFLGKYFTFIERTPVRVLSQKKSQLTFTQKENIKLFCRLIDISDKFSNALLHRTTTLDSDWKSDYFLFNRELPPHLKAN